MRHKWKAWADATLRSSEHRTKTEKVHLDLFTFLIWKSSPEYPVKGTSSSSSSLRMGHWLPSSLRYRVSPDLNPVAIPSGVLCWVLHYSTGLSSGGALFPRLSATYLTSDWSRNYSSNEFHTRHRDVSFLCARWRQTLFYNNADSWISLIKSRTLDRHVRHYMYSIWRLNPLLHEAGAKISPLRQISHSGLFHIVFVRQWAYI